MTTASFDVLPCRESSLEVLMLDIFELVYLPVAVNAEVLEQNHRDIKAQLTSLKFYDFKADCPTFTGILMFAGQPQYFLPGAYIQYVKFDGEDVADEVLAERRFRGNMVELLRSLEEFISVLLYKKTS